MNRRMWVRSFSTRLTSVTFAATAGRRFRTVQATFKVISFWRDRGAFVTLCFQCAVYKLIYLLYKVLIFLILRKNAKIVQL